MTKNTDAMLRRLADLDLTGGQAARALGVSPQTLRRNVPPATISTSGRPTWTMRSLIEHVEELDGGLSRDEKTAAIRRFAELLA